MTTYAVTGATGPFGHHVVENLLDRGIAPRDIVAIVRTPGKAADLAARGVDVRAGDYSQPESLPSALAGVDTLLLVSSSEVGQRFPQHRSVVDAAKAPAPHGSSTRASCMPTRPRTCWRPSTRPPRS